MKRHEFQKEFSDILDQMRTLVTNKNHDYAGDEDPLSNLRLCERAGIPTWVGIASSRITDKVSRILNFCKTDELKVKSESVEDTLVDLANYSIICLIAYRDHKKGKEPLEDAGDVTPPTLLNEEKGRPTCITAGALPDTFGKTLT